MKKKNVIIVIIAIIILIALFIFLKGKIIINNYRTINSLETNEISEEKLDEFQENSKKIGFKESKCTSNRCVATNENDYVEVNINQNEKKEIYLNLIILNQDFNTSLLTKKINTLINNYYGYSFKESYVDKAYNKLKNKEGYGDSDVYISNYIDNSDYTIMFNLEYYENSYTVRVGIILPETVKMMKVMYGEDKIE